ncbi:hypothetical protein [Geitlerinema sp. PCC 9228]|nr:hypothetical protein [Geitlerinema sp. PCC 9228]
MLAWSMVAACPVFPHSVGSGGLQFTSEVASQPKRDRAIDPLAGSIFC